MKNKEVIFSRNTIYNGKNGYSICKGLDLTDWDKSDNDIYLKVINTRGTSASCKIAIPKKDIQLLINTLQEFLC